MPTAALLLREPASPSLTSTVEKSQQQQPPFSSYELRLSSLQLDFLPLTAAPKSPPDEGFESDLDTLSIVSSEDSVASDRKSQETDSANGSSDSDTDTPATSKGASESYHLVDCMCYTDIKVPDILVFIVKGDCLVFRFDNLESLKSFHRNFSTLKAIASQKHQGKKTRFNLLQRTDKNGVTHIEITKEEVKKEEKKESRRSSSTENILDLPALSRKVWNSAEDLLDAPKHVDPSRHLSKSLDSSKHLDSPKRPERRRKQKPRAPPPPTQPPPPKEEATLTKLHRMITNRDFLTMKPKEPLFQQFRYVEPKKIENYTLATDFLKASPKRDPKKDPKPKPPPKVERYDNPWTYSVPRFLKKPRSQSETRNFTPMAYRYIDTTRSYTPANCNVSNRLFGMNSKLKDFSVHDGTLGRNCDWYEGRRSSLGELTYKMNGTGGSLKSVIKKEDGKKRGNDKKVTFSAYTTVQVV